MRKYLFFHFEAATSSTRADKRVFSQKKKKKTIQDFIFKHLFTFTHCNLMTDDNPFEELKYQENEKKNKR